MGGAYTIWRKVKRKGQNCQEMRERVRESILNSYEIKNKGSSLEPKVWSEDLVVRDRTTERS